MRINNISKQFGQSLIEVLVTLVVLMLMVVAFIAVVTNSLKNSQFAQKQIQATKYAQEAMDKIKTIRDLDDPSPSGVGFQQPSGSVNCGACTVNSTCSFSTLFNCKLSNDAASPCTVSIPPGQSPILGCFLKLSPDGTQLKEPTGSTVDEDLGEGLLRRIYIQDGVDFNTAKTVKVTVSWTDSSGTHQSDLQTVLVPK